VLLAAARETGLLAHLEAALPRPRAEEAGATRLAHVTPTSGRMLLLTVLFLGVVGLHRTWDLRGYTGAALALLTGRRRAYGYRHVERFLAECAQAGAAAALTDALAGWTAQLWPPRPTVGGSPLPSFYYVDGHRKAVYADHLIPRGLVARRGTVLGCRALVVLHDAAGHPLLVTTQRGDLHLTVGAPALLEQYERVTGALRVAAVVIDREGMAAEFLHQLAAAGRTVVTVLRADQYTGLSSFTQVGAFVPLRYDQQGTVVREVAPARYCLPLPDHPNQTLELCVALVRDLRRHVPCAPADDDLPRYWAADLDPQDRCWWEEGWIATPAPAPATAAKLIPIVTTASLMDPVALAETYFHRWPAQENAIRDFLIPLGLDTNHGYAKVPVVNSEVAKRRAGVEQRLATIQRWAEGARVRAARASALYHRLWTQTKAYGDEQYRRLNHRLCALEEQGLDPYQVKRQTRADKAALDADLKKRWERVGTVYTRSNTEFRKHERYCREQRELLRALEDLTASERTMYELNNDKDQVMSVCKAALSNLVMWARDQYFPVTYRQATWARLAPFFRLPGRVVWGPDTVQVDLCPFNDRQLNRDLAAVCAQVQQRQPRLPDGRRLSLVISSAQRPVLDANYQQVA